MTTSQDANAKARRVWEKMAPRYDRDIRFWERIWFGGGRHWVGARVEGRVLDVAVGTGRNIDVYPADVVITGVDLSPAMLAIASRHAADLGREADLREADAHALPFDSDRFDTVVCTVRCPSYGQPGSRSSRRNGSRPAPSNGYTPASPD